MKSAPTPTALAARLAKPVVKPLVKTPAKPAAKRAVKAAVAAAVKAPAKVARKATSKRAVQVPKKPAANELVAAVAPALVAPEKPVKPAKLRLVRDSFTMPETDFALVAVLKARALALGRAAKKSELLRAGLQVLNQQEPKVLMTALDGLQPIKTGRPKRGD